MLDFICNGSIELFGTGRERKIQNENICLHRDSNPHHASPRQESQRLRPLGHEGLMVISCLMSYGIMGYKFKKQEAQRATYRAPEYNVPPFWRIGQGGHSFFPIGPKNTNLVEDVEISLLVKFRWIPFSGFRGEVAKCHSQSEAREAILFSDRPKYTNLVEDVEILLPVKFRLKSV